jgi:hypothetical protein
MNILPAAIQSLNHRVVRCSIFAFAFIAASSLAVAQTDLPSNIDNSLRRQLTTAN